MARGVDERHNPRRQVGADGPWTPWANRTTLGGQAQASATSRYDPRFPHELSVEPKGERYEASFSFHEPGERGRTYVSDYSPNTTFKSPERAKLAAEAMANRVLLGPARQSRQNYRGQRYYEPWD